MKTKLILFIILFSVIGCTSTEKKGAQPDDGAIHLNVTSALSKDGIAFEDLVESIDKIIPLQQNTADAIVAEVINYIVTNEYIYILDTYEGRSVAVFDIDGNFITRIKRGGGPGEINAGYSIFFDNDDNRLFVFDFFVIKEYTKEGKFVRSYPIDYSEIGGDIKDIKKLPDGFLAAIQKSYEQCHIVKLDPDLNILWKTNLPILSQEFPKTVVQGYNGNLWIVRGIDNDIYKFTGDSIKVFYHLDFKEYEHVVKKEYHGPESVKYYLELMRNIESGKYIFHNMSFSESQNYLSFSMWNGNNFTNIFYNTRTKDIVKTTKAVGSLFYVMEKHKAMSTGDFFYGCISPERISEKSEWNWNGINPNNLLSDEDMVTLKNAKPDDNPIIVIYKLKDNL